ncbi:MAG: helix-turn-helix domain-containing protein [Patescibacteria group bacterium]
MKISQATKHLESIGFSTTESEVYLIGWQHGPRLSVSDLQKYTEIKRPTIYHALGTLEEKELVEKTTNGKKTVFRFARPEKLREHLRLRLDQARKDLLKVESLIKILNQSQSSSGIYIGSADVMSVLQGLALEVGKDSLIILPTEISDDLLMILESYMLILSGSSVATDIAISPSSGFMVASTDWLNVINIDEPTANRIGEVVIGRGDMYVSISQTPQLVARKAESADYMALLGSIARSSSRDQQ